MIAAAFALIGSSLIVILRSRGIFGSQGIRSRLIGAALLWVVAGIGWLLALNQQGFNLERLGLWSFGWRQFGFGSLFGVLGLLSFLAYILTTKKFGGSPPATDTLHIISSASMPQRLFMLVTAAGAEEIIFRAVAIGGMMAAGIPHAAAVAIPLVIFILLHRSSWGMTHLMFVAIAGGLMTGAFILGGLWAAIIAHLIVDAPMFLAGKALSKRNWSAKNELNERS